MRLEIIDMLTLEVIYSENLLPNEYNPMTYVDIIWINGNGWNVDRRSFDIAEDIVAIYVYEY